jgi:sec-independent protein translocase protein TatA
LATLLYAVHHGVDSFRERNAMNFGAPELIIVLLVVLLLFGGAKLPQLARSIGQAKKEFHEGAAEPTKKEGTEA